MGTKKNKVNVGVHVVFNPSAPLLHTVNAPIEKAFTHKTFPSILRELGKQSRLYNTSYHIIHGTEKQSLLKREGKKKTRYHSATFRYAHSM